MTDEIQTRTLPVTGPAVTEDMIRAGRAAHHKHGCGAVREIYGAMQAAAPVDAQSHDGLRHRIATITIDDEGHRNSELQQVLVAGYVALKWALPLQAADETLTAIVAALGTAQGPALAPVAWRWRYRRDEELGRWLYNDEHPGSKGAEIEVEPLYASPVSSTPQADFTSTPFTEQFKKDAQALRDRVSQTSTTCQKCGSALGGEAAQVGNEVWCHPCADDAPASLQDKVSK